ncbi:hypothetical protein Cyrtocomes_01163 [Candidatus Cyrtobacter comes]|uniref:Uncharacterized protein n=1 Tax=Candidatus Cyrtobacter comes TaxID=675776 RepID=A0ABU5L9G7_9RICK|nr:hypothetical protein [Candidatus Cyrtobacter comes]MDZ5762769.1 hypothetical protein [Candidatus Cyrtobacter comes]
MNISHQYIVKLASEAFWSFVFKNSFKEAGFVITIEDIPESLWSREILLKMLSKDLYPVELSQDLIDTLYYDVAETIIDHNNREENIIGIVYQEDFKFCKDPNFAFKNLIDKQFTDSDQKSNYYLQLKGKYLNEGELILRTPLPSGILLKSRPTTSSMPYIPNTLKALGFQKQLVLQITDILPLPANKYGYNYFITGLFYIPTIQDHSLVWLKLIPNATTILNCFRIICYEDGSFCEGNILPKSPTNKKNLINKMLSFFY